MAAIVGAAGMRPALAAARAGKRVLLANKETLVMAGQFFMDAVKAGGATLLPIDSEHNAVFQSMPEPAMTATWPATASDASCSPPRADPSAPVRSIPWLLSRRKKRSPTPTG
jgi:1-deoxy-D-xylulose 5-phosphate reductoisomerase